MSTEELIKRCLERDVAAWDVFVRRYQRLISRSVRYKLKRLNVRTTQRFVDDIVQDIFLLMWEKDKLSGIRDIRSVEDWLVMLSINSASNYCRDRTFRESEKAFSLEKIINSEKGAITLGDILPSPAPGIHREIENRDLENILEREMAFLCPREQLAIKLNAFDGKTQNDISEIMKIPSSTVATLIRRGKQKLRERLGAVLKQGDIS